MVKKPKLVQCVFLVLEPGRFWSRNLSNYLDMLQPLLGLMICIGIFTLCLKTTQIFLLQIFKLYRLSYGQFTGLDSCTLCLQESRCTGQ